MLRQLSYATTRSALYDLFKEHIQEDGHPVVPFYDKAIIAGTAGAIAGFIGTPADTVNVRMQHDIKLPVEKRRNYKHALDGIYKIAKNEGFSKLFSGASMASSRAFLMSIGTFSVYDQTKEIVISHEIAHDDVFVHLYVSCFAAFCSTAMVHPVDVLKTRLMNGTYHNLYECFCGTAKMGMLEFYRGFLPAWLRAIPQTALTFIFAEELRMWFGRTEY
uniref:Mitochondrial dicarboxylate carrier n=1 Tax=Acrobeloides nanus TaxID=290746 RepID=A0A914DAR8_9BILA